MNKRGADNFTEMFTVPEAMNFFAFTLEQDAEELRAKNISLMSQLNAASATAAAAAAAVEAESVSSPNSPRRPLRTSVSTEEEVREMWSRPSGDVNLRSQQNTLAIKTHEACKLELKGRGQHRRCCQRRSSGAGVSLSPWVLVTTLTCVLFFFVQWMEQASCTEMHRFLHTFGLFEATHGSCSGVP